METFVKLTHQFLFARMMNDKGRRIFKNTAIYESQKAKISHVKELIFSLQLPKTVKMSVSGYRKQKSLPPHHSLTHKYPIFEIRFELLLIFAQL